ncbi:PSD1 and planctomycete cytochrome C domain-containing protein [Roseibacillus ishigakijimensis]|uniref:PSD1 domain-containing protein n=1 Tax=Roseibacillus ishigakijimensis TaxID=454146 RepID=A0A934VGC7_9BACT|nr:PSD1 and planctomycete cytochrome C domain-containing protein [Roseibacillus ishigakijimensis]MBK1832713.1 PSD1 domain-containing protein [Roseibacillus ishigakijimensis]
MTDQDRLLISSYLAGALDSSQEKALNDLLRRSPEARAELLQQARVDSLLHELGGERPAQVVPFKAISPEEPSRRARWPVWTATAAAALTIAGVVLFAERPQLLAPEVAVGQENPRPLERKSLSREETYSQAIAKLQEAGSQKRAVAQSPALAAAPGERISYNQHIRPILSENCFHCHGPDPATREADIALHEPEFAFAEMDGIAPIVPGDAKASEVVARILDQHDPMPPKDSNRSLTFEEKELLQRWIDEGAEYEKHWAFVPPVKPEPPQVGDSGASVHNPVDQFVQAKLAEKGLEPAPPAEPEVLARRASLALTGLQPDLALLDAYLADPSEAAYERFVDHLLASDAYAERMALFWMDAARYADTDGYQNDHGRTNWPWRDWVIQAYRENMPFDQFTIEQLAGDMLPQATASQRLASAFNRNHRQNNEGGALAEEFLVENVIDRVETTSTVWLGLTTGCARCHDHKYDPISQREFFQLYAYFNNINERGIGRGTEAKPVEEFTSPLFEIPAGLAERLEHAQAQLAKARQETGTRFRNWVASHRPTSEAPDSWEPVSLLSARVPDNQGELTALPDGSYLFEGNNITRTSYQLAFEWPAGKTLSALRVEALPHESLVRLSLANNGNFVLTEAKVSFRPSEEGQAKSLPLARAAASYEQSNYPASQAIDGKAKTGWAVNGNPGESASLFLALAEPLKDAAGGTVEVTLEFFSSFTDHNIGRLRLATSQQAGALGRELILANQEVRAALEKEEAAWTGAERKLLREHFATIDSVLGNAQARVAAVEKELARAGFAKVPVMVMSEKSGEPAPAYLLNRGQYNEPDTSEALPRRMLEALLPGEEHPQDRLELARWLVSRENPITARVVVNRMWQRMMGIGLVKTSEDFGSQGELPVNQDLLDWLAMEFIDSGWDVKGLYRTIVTSHAFRQSSRTNPGLQEVDPENRYLARGPRYRMDGFAIRDLALNASGLLYPKVGGAPVKPYQPAGLWESVAANAGTRYVESKGKDLFRKSMYSYWKRAVNPPRQNIFDASGREVCNVRHKITNTPLQALALMNDETFVEAARHLAARGLREGGATAKERLAHIYRLATGYSADEEELAIFLQNRRHFAEHFASHPAEARDFLSIGATPRDEDLDLIDHAADTATAHLILNLDETITLE